MSYTILSATYCNEDGSAVIAHTEEVGSVIISRDDMPDLWALLDGIDIASFAPPQVDPEDISDRQFAQQLAIMGTITEAEAVAWAARGELPPAMEAAVAALPEGERFAATMLLSSARTYEFSHPLGPQIGALLGFSEEQRRALWLAAAAL
ncbi:hypothetical protein [Bosea minatitlanensis]|uniref:Uncharacterized protein n=1 Tax=Bosea minatitlanensis TaxID=128782 RepID=A0ABW0EZG5_9HYPH|nr:hypothetical protein [Bosea minatitlanensis]MCT4492696.1 hypothetical protein [Bosea minatitlanensis]